VCRADAADAGARKSRKASYIVDVLVNCEPGAAGGAGPARAPRLLSAAVKGAPLVVPFPLEQVPPPMHTPIWHHQPHFEAGCLGCQ
jgi:hypothetical protein